MISLFVKVRSTPVHSFRRYGFRHRNPSWAARTSIVVVAGEAYVCVDGVIGVTMCLRCCLSWFLIGIWSLLVCVTRPHVSGCLAVHWSYGMEASSFFFLFTLLSTPAAWELIFFVDSCLDFASAWSWYRLCVCLFTMDTETSCLSLMWFERIEQSRSPFDKEGSHSAATSRPPEPAQQPELISASSLLSYIDKYDNYLMFRKCLKSEYLIEASTIRCSKSKSDFGHRIVLA
jgi:hypothetical protein